MRIQSLPLYLLKPLCLAALLCATAGAQAGATVYTSRSEFLSAVSAPGVDIFDDLAVGPYGDTVFRIAAAYNDQAYSATGIWGGRVVRRISDCRTIAATTPSCSRISAAG